MKRPLRLDSADAREIENEQYNDALTAREFNQSAGLEAKFPHAVRCSRETARYNCHGMTFASRRTGIFDVSVLQQILREDGYQEIKPAEVLAGDVILYFNDDGDIEHSGVVVDTQVGGIGGLRIPMVRSKWGKGKEFVHPANHCPYAFGLAKYFRIP